MFNKFKKAFTMAEVLMVLGIIGVVAALTIPNLKDNADEQFYVAKASKVYSEMETAFSRATLKYGNAADWDNMVDTKVGTALGSKMAKYLDVTDTCGTGANSICWNSNTAANNGYKLVLKDGTSVAFVNNLSATPEIFRTLGAVTPVLIDLDGPKKGPNTLGIDQFYIWYMKNASLNAGTFTSGTPNNGSYLAWVLKFGNQDYMKCGSTLNFNGNTSCN